MISSQSTLANFDLISSVKDQKNVQETVLKIKNTEVSIRFTSWKKSPLNNRQPTKAVKFVCQLSNLPSFIETLVLLDKPY